MEIQSKGDGNEYANIIVIIKTLGKWRSHLHLHLLFLTPLFNNVFVELIWPWIAMHSWTFNINEHALDHCGCDIVCSSVWSIHQRNFTSPSPFISKYNSTFNEKKNHRNSIHTRDEEYEKSLSPSDLDMGLMKNLRGKKKERDCYDNTIQKVLLYCNLKRVKCYRLIERTPGVKYGNGWKQEQRTKDSWIEIAYKNKSYLSSEILVN